jgi:phosphatidylserine decarboxylase
MPNDILMVKGETRFEKDETLPMIHQYIERETGAVRDEILHGDRFVRALYNDALEIAPVLCRIASSARFSSLLAYFNYDSFIGARLSGAEKFLLAWNINFDECVAPPAELNTLRKIFERQIKYWQNRPLPEDERAILCPADARAIVGSLAEDSKFFIKGKFFETEELLGVEKREWFSVFRDGSFALFRLTPEKYHYTHTPVAGRIADYYELDGRFHSCNPAATVALIGAHSKNRRVVTIFETDVKGGTQVGFVAMIEIVALMIGRIESCYSATRYDAPQQLTKGMFLQRGQPKALFQPGSSTVLLLFQKDRVRFADDLLVNLNRQDVNSRFSRGLGRAVVETDVRVRSLLGRKSDAA